MSAADVERHVRLPDFPVGTSPAFVEAKEAIRIGYHANVDLSDLDSQLHPWSVATNALIELPAKTPADIAAKAILLLHEISPDSVGEKQLGYDAGHVPTDDCVRILLSIVDDASALAVAACGPRDRWDFALAAYDAARKAETEYERLYYCPAATAEDAGEIARVPAEIEAYLSIAMDARIAAEKALISIPAPTAADLALKFMIALDDDRACLGYLESLVDEARLFTGRATR